MARSFCASGHIGAPIMMPRHALPALAALLAVSLAGCGDADEDAFHGYIEGEFLYLSAPQGGYLQSLDAPKGTRVATGDTLFVIAAEPDDEGLAEAEARVAAARERLENLQTPRRPAEIASLEAQVRAAATALELAETQLRQQQTLARARFIAQARLDEARAARDRAAAELDAAREQLAVFRGTLGRSAEVEGAAADLRAAEAGAAQKRWAVARKTVAAPAAGEVTGTYYRPGEWVPAGQPVAGVLPDARRRIRFFVPEPALAGLEPGQAVEARCDGCTAPIRGRIDFIAAEAEYTPPVIYSRGVREKLVFRVEAAPVPEDALRLRPGLPVDVRVVANGEPAGDGG
jgi:HlyD family secretion protein